MAVAPPRLILGSSSPRRLQLLAQIGVTPDLVKGPDIDETPKPKEIPDAYCLRMALEKNAALQAEFANDYIITADTTVVVGRRILGKPDDRDDAEKMLKLLSGRAHRIYTSLAVKAPGRNTTSRLSISRVKVKHIGESELQEFLADEKNWQGFAGSYSLQGQFARFIINVQGSPSGIIGLPLYETTQLLKGQGYGTAN